jgi:hypothetical protein
MNALAQNATSDSVTLLVSQSVSKLLSKSVGYKSVT